MSITIYNSRFLPFFLVCLFHFCITISTQFYPCSNTEIFNIVIDISFQNRQKGQMIKYPSKKRFNMFWNIGSAKYDWSNIALTLNLVFHPNSNNHKLLRVQCLVLISPYIYTSIHYPHFLMTMIGICVKNLLTRYHKWSYVGKNQKPMLMK